LVANEKPFPEVSPGKAKSNVHGFPLELKKKYKDMK
jgi:hypothetical protein